MHYYTSWYRLHHRVVEQSVGKIPAYKYSLCSSSSSVTSLHPFSPPLMKGVPGAQGMKGEPGEKGEILSKSFCFL